MKIYFVGICGVMMAPLAVSMRARGHEVAGSDKGFYPPISTYLRKNSITLFAGYKPEHIPNDVDIAVIGAGILPTNPEYLEIQKRNIPHYSGYAGFLRDYFLKKHTITIAGTYGKTTITAFCAYVLDQAGYNPTFAIGGIPLNFPDGVRYTDSDWAVCEGDEYINARDDMQAKFLYYAPEYLVLNAVKPDHQDVYKTDEVYINAYKELIASMPVNATIIANADGEHIAEALQSAGERNIVSVDTLLHEKQKNPIYLEKITTEAELTEFLVSINKNVYAFSTPLIGMHNIQNLVMGIALAYTLGISIDVIQKSVMTFTNVKRRLEIISEKGPIVIDDLAHTPIKAQSTLQAIRQKYPQKKIYAVFEPHTLGMRMKSSLSQFSADAFANAAEVLITPIYHPGAVPEENRVTPDAIASQIGAKAHGFHDYENLRSYLTQHVPHDAVLVFMSSGNIGGLLGMYTA